MKVKNKMNVKKLFLGSVAISFLATTAFADDTDDGVYVLRTDNDNNGDDGISGHL